MPSSKFNLKNLSFATQSELKKFIILRLFNNYSKLKYE